MFAVSFTLHDVVGAQNAQPLRDCRDGLLLDGGKFSDTGRAV